MRSYDLAVSQNLITYFMRLLHCADPTINPVQRHRLDFASRRQGILLAFRALSNNIKPTIWAEIRYEYRNCLNKLFLTYNYALLDHTITNKNKSFGPRNDGLTGRYINSELQNICDYYERNIVLL